MSGFEVAGLVLGAFPLLVEGANSLQDVFSDVRSWWRFEATFESFISAVEAEYIKYSLTLNILVGDLDIDQDEQDKLQNDTSCTLWHAPHVQAELRRRVGSQYYGWFTRQLSEMNTALRELFAMLPIGKVHHLDSKSLESEMFRLRMSFSSRKDQLMSKVGDKNQAIYEFLERASRVNQAKTPPRSIRVPTQPFLESQEIAADLFTSFQKDLTCTCGSEHPCGIAVGNAEVRGQPTVQFKMLFRDGTSPKQISFERISTSHGRSNTKARFKHQETALGAVTDLQQQVATKNRFDSLKKTGPKSIMSLAASSTPVLNIFARDSSQKIEWDKPENKLKKPFRSRWKLLSGSGNKENRSSRAAVPPTLSRKQTTVATAVSEPTRGVRFADTDDAASEQNATLMYPNAKLIHDLCSAILIEQSHSCIGYLQPHDRSRLFLNLEPVNQATLQLYQYETVEAFLKATPRRDVRLQVGHALAKSVLYLGTSAWVPNRWSKSELLLLRDPDQRVPQPYFIHNSLRTTLSNNKNESSSTQARLALFSLGVLLLELVFRDTLENQPFRAEMLGPNNEANEAADLATALVWQRRVEEELGDELANAIKRCLYGMLDSVPDINLGSSEFIQAASLQIIKPLENFLSAWGRS